MRIVDPLTEAEREAFVAACRAFLTSNDGKPAIYRHRGRTAARVDCIGVPLLGLVAVGRTVHDRRTYSPRPDGHTLREVLQAHLGDPLPKAEMRVGDIPLLYWHVSEGVPLYTHVGVVTPLPYPGPGFCLLHAWADEGRVVEHRIDERWMGRVTEVYRP